MGVSVVHSGRRGDSASVITDVERWGGGGVDGVGVPLSTSLGLGEKIKIKISVSYYTSEI